MKPRPLLVTVALLVAVSVTLASYPRLVETWQDEEHEKVTFKKLIVVGITDDEESRWGFENRFVSHLKGRGVDAMASYSLVPDLTKMENRQLILEMLEKEQIDGAISVRLVPLKEVKESDWIAEWRERRDAAVTFRALVDETLPITVKKAKKFGVEVDLWETNERYRVWAGRSDGHSIKDLRKETSAFVQRIMDELKLIGLI